MKLFLWLISSIWLDLVDMYIFNNLFMNNAWIDTTLLVKFYHA